MENNFAQMSPAQVRALIREGKITQPTTGMCDGYAQGNLVVLPKELAWDFLLFCQRNPKSCPLLEVADAGSRTFPVFGAGSDIARDIPKYRVYENGVMTGEYTDVSRFFDEPGRELVSFLIGCSFSFESALLEAGVPVRQIEEGVNVPMYNTKHPLRKRGRILRQHGREHAPHSARACARRGCDYGADAARSRHANSDRLSGAYRHSRPCASGLRRRGDHSRKRSSRILALRRDPAGGRHALQAAVCHHARAGTHVHHGRKERRLKAVRKRWAAAHTCLRDFIPQILLFTSLHTAKR